jgi:hypothetical protein
MKSRKIWLGIGALFGLLIIIGFFADKRDLNRPATLHVEGLDEIPVAISESALSDFTALASAGDNIGKGQLVLTGKIFRVPSDTHITILSCSLTSCRFSIRDGDHAGQIAYTYAEWIAR